MTDEEYQFILTDRIAKNQSTDKLLDLQNNSYMAYSGGADSVVNSALLDLSLPNNKIPRVFIDTGIEHQAIRKFVLKQAEKDSRIVILKPRVNIIKMLKNEGYPFKSKQHSQNYGVYFRNKIEVQNELKKIEENPKLKFDYDYIHNLEKGTKSIVKYVLGIREKEIPNNVVERERESYLYEYADCP